MTNKLGRPSGRSGPRGKRPPSDQAIEDERARKRIGHEPRPRSFADMVLKAEGKSALGKVIGLDPATTERDYEPDELEFMMAMHEYKCRRNRPFPTWSEALVILKSLGYRKVDPCPRPTPDPVA